MSDDIPWSFVPERKLTPEDVKYMLSMHYQGTVYNPYSSYDSGRRGMYRSVGINRTGVTTICQIRDDVPDSIRGVEWVCFGSTTFSAMLPIYTNVHRLPGYLSKVAKDVSTDNLFWSSRLIGAMADHDYPACVQHIERYQNAVVTEGRRIVLEYDRKVAEASSSATDGKAAVQSAENAI